MTQRLFCFGLGYSAHGLAAHLQQRAAGWQVAGTDRGDGRPNRFQLGGDS
ncbi:MAG: SDR family NAD(P)-dependent oxidoreductase, partial [Alphaproteobacteria bacterium]|nr:SDR family NAD(P)-dependent oxidoreductase [Alphaproteobacteria bacterium]